jgi:metal-responsive CopG/Arc/MetJ family transcriptional regulator
MKKQICILIEEELLEAIDSTRKNLDCSRSKVIVPILISAFSPKERGSRPTPNQPVKKGD